MSIDFCVLCSNKCDLQHALPASVKRTCNPHVYPLVCKHVLLSLEMLTETETGFYKRHKLGLIYNLETWW